ncbi:hypothetical protein ACSSAF_06555 [Staphylococcus succinus]|uniref:hypothetical protein n=1 Tax=Staphylococcus succinus TaxID=61015 RepID=UPI003F5BCE89
MKIKTKKQLNLPQLIEWGWDNGIYSKIFTSPTGGNISFDEYGDIVDVYRIEPNDAFTVEVEEEITEDTELFLIERYVGGSGNIHYCRYSESSIENAIESNPSDNKSTHFYIENEDRELILIWRDGKLVE